jgi:hypothetical protein
VSHRPRLPSTNLEPQIQQMVQPEKRASNKPPKNNQHIRKCAFQPEGNWEGKANAEFENDSDWRIATGDW